jgi:hypothetical protein
MMEPLPLILPGVSLFVCLAWLAQSQGALAPWIAGAAGGLLLLVLLVLGVGVIWSQARARVRRDHARERRWQWGEEPRPLEGQPAALDEEWKRLGYAPLGFLREESRPGGTAVYLHVYLHPELPIYALTEVVGTTGTPSLVSFWEGGGHLLTTAAPPPVGGVPPSDARAPRLVQLRVAGTPTALDGQHVGTVRAWTGGNRRPLPHTREALPGYLEADHRRLAEQLEAIGWLPLPAFLRSLAGQHPGVLRF